MSNLKTFHRNRIREYQRLNDRQAREARDVDARISQALDALNAARSDKRAIRARHDAERDRLHAHIFREQGRAETTESSSYEYQPFNPTPARAE